MKSVNKKNWGSSISAWNNFSFKNKTVEMQKSKKTVCLPDENTLEHTTILLPVPLWNLIEILFTAKKNE